MIKKSVWTNLLHTLFYLFYKFFIDKKLGKIRFNTIFAIIRKKFRLCEMLYKLIYICFFSRSSCDKTM